MKFLARYGIGIYLLVTLMFKLSFIIPSSITHAFYYLLMFYGLIAFFFFKNIILSGPAYQRFYLFYSINFLNLVYFLFFNIATESALYLFSKIAISNLIMLGIVYNYTYYKNWFIKYFKYAMFIMVLLGKLFGTVELSSEAQRLSVGFNPNDVGVFGMLGVLSIIVLDKVWHKKKINIILFLFFAIITLLSGSKAALLGMVLGIFFTYGFNYRIFFVAFFLMIAAYFSSNLGYVTSLDRLNSNERAFETRDEVYSNGIKTIQEHVFLGHGLDKYNWTNPIYWDSPDLALGPHNTYLAVTIMYGIFFGFVFIIFILKFAIKTFKKSFKSDDYFIRFCCYIILIFLVNGFFETLIVGVNEFVTLLFWFAIGCVGYNFCDSSKKEAFEESYQK